jgi:CheY-like chemotaxis protein
MTTVLLVEEDRIVRTLLRRILDQDHYEVLEAGNATEALDLGSAHPGPIDLLLADAVLPEMTAAELARRMTVLRPQIKAMCMSGYPGEVLCEKGLLDPHMILLEKPFMPETFLEAVRRLLSDEG